MVRIIRRELAIEKSWSCANSATSEIKAARNRTSEF